jgi:hypothetical protein
MADVKISQLPAATTPVVGTEVLPIVQSGTTSQVSINAATGITRPFTANGVMYASSSSALATGSTLVFDGTNVGIGISSPTQKLDVSGAIKSTGYFIGSTGTSGFVALGTTGAVTDGGAIVGRSATSTYNPSCIEMYTAGTQKMLLDASGNLGIGTTANASAILDAQSTTKGVRMPNMTTTQKNAIASPAAGLMVFDTTLAKLAVYSGSAWQTVTSV